MKLDIPKNKIRTLPELEKRRILSKVIDGVIIEQPSNYRKIYDAACEYYGCTPIETTDHDLKAIMVNAIRHRFSNYDESLSLINALFLYSRLVDYKRYKNATLEKIATAYPFLRSACMSQKGRVNMVSVVRR